MSDKNNDAPDLKKLFDNAYTCHQISDFETYNDFDSCIQDLKVFANKLPTEYKFYKEAVNAAEASVGRIMLQKNIKFSKLTGKEYLESRIGFDFIRNQEVKNWTILQQKRVEANEPIETSNIWFENMTNLLIIATLFFALYIYKLISSKDIVKIKAKNLLGKFQLKELQALVDEDLAFKSNYKINFFTIKEELGEKNLTEHDIIRINKVYRHIGILEQAYQVYLKENKINFFAGINLDDNKINESVKEFLKKVDE